MAAVVGGIALVGPGCAAASGTTTTTAHLNLAQWKHSYESAIGKIADGALAVWDTGHKRAKDPTEKKVKATIASCRRWHDDAETVPGEIPPIPQTSAERAWNGLVSASLSASADCLTALQDGSRPAARDFEKEMAAVSNDERTLASQLAGNG